MGGVVVMGAMLSSAIAREARDVRDLQSKITKLKDDIDYLKTSVESLDKLQTRLQREIEQNETSFQTRFERVLVPLLNWPHLMLTTRLPSWIDQEHMKIVLVAARSRVIREPLQLIGEREVRYKQTSALKTDFSENLKALESKQALLDLQLEELRAIHKRALAKKSRGSALKTGTPQLENLR
jgi:DNA repair exonuclease SbcCD ATPase subunit